jgi:hypothetical protein
MHAQAAVSGAAQARWHRPCPARAMRLCRRGSGLKARVCCLSWGGCLVGDKLPASPTCLQAVPSPRIRCRCGKEIWGFAHALHAQSGGPLTGPLPPVARHLSNLLGLYAFKEVSLTETSIIIITCGVEDAVVPQASRGERCVRLCVVLCRHVALERRLLRPLPPLPLALVALHLRPRKQINASRSDQGSVQVVCLNSASSGHCRPSRLRLPLST